MAPEYVAHFSMAKAEEIKTLLDNIKIDLGKGKAHISEDQHERFCYK